MNTYDSSIPYDPSPAYASGQTGYTVDTANELSQLQYGATTPLSLASDADGNLTSDQVPTSQPGVYQARGYAWDDSDRLRSVTAGASVETYCQTT